MTMHRFSTTAVAGAIALHALTAAASAQEKPGAKKPVTPTPAVEQRFENQPKPPSEQEQREADQRMRERWEDAYWRRPTFRLFQDYALAKGESTREVHAILADVRIDGMVRQDVAVIVGDATIGSTAVIEGSLLVIGGSATVEAGAKVTRDVVVLGGTLTAPPGFEAGHEHVVLGTPVVADTLRALSPWLTRGLLLGRLIVPGLGWVWTVVAISFLLGLVLNQMFARPVGACATTLERRPGAAFFVGLLVILLAGPALAIVAITVIGLPFALMALTAAGVIGKLGVTRAIGRGMVNESESTNKGQALRSYVLGAGAITLAYMVPVLGLLTWMVIGVFGLGTATMTFMTSLRREKPTPPPIPVAPPPVEPPPVSPPPYSSPAYSSPAPVAPSSNLSAFSDAGAEMPLSTASAGDAFRAEPPPVFAPPPAPPPMADVPPPAFSVPDVAYTGDDLRRYPKATFLDRMAAFAIDAILVALVYGILVDGILFRRFNDDGAYAVMLIGYHIAFWAWKSTTLGGIICNLQMVRTTGEDPRFIDALVRGLTAIFSAVALGIGCFWMISDPDRQMWHDKVAGTVVVKVPREKILR